MKITMDGKEVDLKGTVKSDLQEIKVFAGYALVVAIVFTAILYWGFHAPIETVIGFGIGAFVFMMVSLILMSPSPMITKKE
jgi:hypothetical protein